MAILLFLRGAVSAETPVMPAAIAESRTAPPRSRGVTLVETLLTLAVAATVLGLGLPALGRLAADLRMTATVNALVGHVQLARAEAARRNAAVVLCKAADTPWPACAGSDEDWSAGWLVFAAHHSGNPTRLSDPDSVLAQYRPPRRVGPIGANRNAFVFQFGLRSTNGTLVVCDRRGAEQARAVIISHTGRPRASRRAAGGAELTCPP